MPTTIRNPRTRLRAHLDALLASTAAGAVAEPCSTAAYRGGIRQIRRRPELPAGWLQDVEGSVDHRGFCGAQIAFSPSEVPV